MTEAEVRAELQQIQNLTAEAFAAFNTRGADRRHGGKLIAEVARRAQALNVWLAEYGITAEAGA